MIAGLITIIAIVLAIPAFVLLIQVLSAYFFKNTPSMAVQENLTTSVLVPAHNESTGIIATLNSLKVQLSTHDRLLVVADNCTDDTAEVARQYGAEVIERTDDAKRGKGYALDFGIQHLKDAPSDVLVIVDADCVVEEGGLKKLATYAYQEDKPAQALYLMHAQDKQNIKTSVAEFAWCVKNLVRPLGFANLGLPCQLMGTGMAFPWPQIANIDLANGNIVEDMKLGVDFAVGGNAPLFYPEAKVTSFFPLTNEVQKGQSKRWEHGHLAMILSEAPKLLMQGLRKAKLTMVMMALDLSVPPLALFVAMLVGFAVFSTLAFSVFSVAELAFKISLFSLFALTIAIILAWWGFGRNIISFSSMLYIPVYILQKVPSYVGFIFKRQSAWNKTEREQD